jgi:cell wall-associated NlpC family hydrolase
MSKRATIGASYTCNPSDTSDTSAADTVAGSSRRYVNVNVATLWQSPQANRAIDEPSLRAPADIPAWLDAMSVPDKLWLVGRTETEALYGEPVELLEERGGWARVAVPAQAAPQRGYPGWLPKRQLADRSAATAFAGCRQAIVNEPTAWLYADETLQHPVLQLSFGTRLPVAAERGAALQVATPTDGLHWLAARDADVRGGDLPPQKEQPDGDAVVRLGKRFLGLPYVWAGTSGFGFDCSGFTYSLYRNFGIELPRDAKDQAKAGRSVDPGKLQPGDLLFYAYDKGRGAVHHVAIYAGDGMMLHSPKTERSVELIPMSTPAYASEFAGARRFLSDRRDFSQKE